MLVSKIFAGIDVQTNALSPDTDIPAITCDSRKAEQGGILVCITGTAVDGHDFAAKAIENGVAAVVVERDLGLPRQIIVSSTRLAWAQMSANWFSHPADKLHLIGITGTNGKTTTACLIKSILTDAGYKVGLVGTIQNMIGERVLPAARTTPDPYDLQSLFALMVAEGCDYCVMEVSSHALDQDRVAGCTFDAAVFSNLTQDHLDYHGTMENYMLAKKRLFSMCRVAILNADDKWSEQLSNGLTCPIMWYSTEKDTADFTAKNIRYRPDGVRFELVHDTDIDRIHLHIPGHFSVYNGMAAAACAIAIGIPFDKTVASLCAAQGVKGRAEIVPTGKDFTVVIDYAHTPDGLENICQTLKDCCKGRLITVFGCGGDRDRTKRPQMGEIAARIADIAVVTSDNPRTENPAAIIEDILGGMQKSKKPLHVIENRIEAIHFAIHLAQPDDTVLLAGKGHETYQILKDGVIHLDEREVVAEALATLNS